MRLSYLASKQMTTCQSSSIVNTLLTEIELKVLTMSKFALTNGMDQNEIDRRTKNLLDLFKRNFLQSNSDDFVSDALANMMVCNSVYAKIFEGYLALAEKRNIPQEIPTVLLNGCLISWMNLK